MNSMTTEKGKLIDASQAFYLNRLLLELFPVDPGAERPGKVIWLSSVRLFRTRRYRHA
ncbi:hypothetical protein [Oligoflexus tunisiensis]|uniref:hypothetical protein n=1 Tax=Oligoflexus tunisiensis TaxID=708132 RepID=UPI001C405281|nr:hypothetical protein [Oligoflexus tunisiensis]